MKNKDKVSNGLSVEELKTKINELNESLMKLKMQSSTGQLLNTSLIRSSRKELVRAYTFLTQKSSKTLESVKR